jgi:hypothetical protein
LIKSINMLNPKQELVLRLVSKAFQDNNQLKLIVTGAGGTGKSFLIHTIVKYSNYYFGSSKSTLVMAPTGVAAYNIGGTTIHQGLGLVVQSENMNNNESEHASQASISRLEKSLVDVKLIIIDEFSMVGAEKMNQINSKLNLARSKPVPINSIELDHKSDKRSNNKRSRSDLIEFHKNKVKQTQSVQSHSEFKSNFNLKISHGENSQSETVSVFGGIHIIFLGDIFQLPPVRETFLYQLDSENLSLNYSNNMNLNGQPTLSGSGSTVTFNLPETQSNLALKTLSSNAATINIPSPIATDRWKNSEFSSKKHQGAQIGQLLWRSIEHVIVLDQQQRQSDPVFSASLNRMRLGKCEEKDITLINTRVISDIKQLQEQIRAFNLVT